MTEYFNNEGTTLYVVTPNAMNVYSERAKITAVKAKIKANAYLQDPDTTDTYVSWLDKFEAYCATLSTNDCMDDADKFDSNLKVRGGLKSACYSSPAGRHRARHRNVVRRALRQHTPHKWELMDCFCVRASSQRPVCRWGFGLELDTFVNRPACPWPRR